MTRLSLPKDKIRILLLEGINDSAVAMFGDSGYVSLERFPKALDAGALKEAVKGVHLLGIRSRSHVTEEILEAADRLLAVGCFSVGTNQIDLEAARRRGIPVFNAPYANTRSVAEMIIGELIFLARRLGDRTHEVHAGVWKKVASGCFEIRGKTLGIVGYGSIGAQLSVLA